MSAKNSRNVFSARIESKSARENVWMSDFEYYMAFYGLLLGLSAATVLGRLADVVGARRKIKIGWLTPMLAVFVLLQMTGIWAWTWSLRSSIVVTWPVLFEASIVSSGFYLGAALIFPRDIDSWDNLDEHYWQNKRLTAGIIMLCALIFTSHNVSSHPGLLTTPAWLGWSALYYIPIASLAASKTKYIDAVALSILIAQLLLTGMGLV
jgi:hypothetical protein